MSAERRRIPGVEAMGLRGMNEGWRRGWQGTRICCGAVGLLTQCQYFLSESPVMVRFGLGIQPEHIRLCLGAQHS